MSKAQNPEHPPLAELLAMAMRHAREVRGYSIDQVDRALATAIAVEAMQRAAMLIGTPPDETPAPDAVAEILHQVIEDVREEALKAVRRRAH